MLTSFNHAVQDVSLLLSKAPSEAHREAAALREAQAALKLEAGRLGRAEMVMRQKVRPHPRLCSHAWPHPCLCDRALCCLL